MPVPPVYRFDPTLVFPEIPPVVDKEQKTVLQSTEECPDALAGITLTISYLLSGGLFQGALADLTMDKIYAEIETFCVERRIDINRVFAWAESIAIPSEMTLSAEDIERYVPKRMEGVGFDLDDYQRDVAAWNAIRLGSIQALGCGIGKSATSTAAAITAARMGRCSTERCFIICPLNAVPQWKPYLIDLKQTFKTVDIITVDSLHLIQGIERFVGGAVIIDEAHKLKNYGAQRTNEAHLIRPAFEWAVCLTGTLLHTGPEGVLSVQDLACPGLSRFLDKWAFGNVFNCISNKKIPTKSGFIFRRSLVIPTEASRQPLEKYLTRSVRSLRFESEEVVKSFTVPKNERTIIRTFKPSDWHKSLTFVPVSKNDTYEKVLKEKVEYLSLADTPVEILGPAIAVAILIEEREQHELFLAGLSEENKRYMPEEQLAYPGLPAFSAVLHRMLKLGWEDLVLTLSSFWLDTDKTVPQIGYRFFRPPGNSITNPAIGPKLLWLQDWLDEHPDDAVVIGAASVNTLDLIQTMMYQKRITFRLIRGGVSSKDREKFIEDFQAGLFRVMLLQQVAGSESVTLTKAKYSILVDHDFSPIPYSQFIHRIYRRSQKFITNHIDLVLNEIQYLLLKRVQRGEAFDADVRKQIEKIIKYDEFKSSFPVATP